MKRADVIRRFDDSRLAEFVSLIPFDIGEVFFCQNRPECNVEVDLGMDIPVERCKACALEWLETEVGGNDCVL